MTASPPASPAKSGVPSAEGSTIPSVTKTEPAEHAEAAECKQEEEQTGRTIDGVENNGKEQLDEDNAQSELEEGETAASAPPLPDEVPPPLPNEAPPGGPTEEDDGWEPVWDANAQAYYFYNRFTGMSQWENPRVPGAQQPVGAGTDTTTRQAPVAGGYNPAIHGDYDPTAPYAQQHEQPFDASGAGASGVDPSAAYMATGTFNRFTGRWQAAELAPENFNDENKSKRQMRAFFDVDAAANSHDGRSLKAERSGKKLTKQELKHFKEKRREKKEEKRRAWLRD